MPSKLRFLICLLTTLALVFQIIPIVSSPISSHIYLSRYDGRRFGVFGWCSESSKSCTPRRIGYLTECQKANYNGHINKLACDAVNPEDEFLPSRAKRVVSRLLIVHPISLFFAGWFWLLTIAVNAQRFRHSGRIITGAVLWSLPTVFLSLLSFLIDILLFVPFLAWPGWLLFVSTVMTAVASCMMCGVRRSVSMQKYEKLHNTDHVELFHLHFEKPASEDAENSQQQSNGSDIQSELPLERPGLIHRAM
ncbi:LADA_0D08922g1_1 [Lachancea dasiensis]|uniref:LADA_0D08922g1_1 n=1 Tax=Lachancea dasiensis TaxID=1072105 RepID=A0A1G4J722_9SACH|nr:LADA_0D08922g1_1 [Lachancea dasiensis]